MDDEKIELENEINDFINKLEKNEQFVKLKRSTYYKAVFDERTPIAIYEFAEFFVDEIVNYENETVKVFNNEISNFKTIQTYSYHNEIVGFGKYIDIKTPYGKFLSPEEFFRFSDEECKDTHFDLFVGLTKERIEEKISNKRLLLPEDSYSSKLLDIRLKPAFVNEILKHRHNIEYLKKGIKREEYILVRNN